MQEHIFMGAATALITPFDVEGQVNYCKLDELIQFQLDNGCNALLICGVTGEIPTLTMEERMSVIAFAAKAINGRVPLIAGTGGNNTAQTAEECKLLEEAGADALQLTTPYFNMCTQKGLYMHFSACAQATGLPFIIYNAPFRTGMSIYPETYGKLLKLKNIRAVNEGSGSIEHCIKLKSLYGDKLDVYCGCDSIIAPVLEAGACGCISVLANIFPQSVQDLCGRYFAGDAEKCMKLQIQLSAFIEVLFSEVSPIPVKTAMNIKGMNVGDLRLPLCAAEKATAEKLKKELSALNTEGVYV